MPDRAIKRFRDFFGRIKRSDFESFPRFFHSAAFSWIMLVALSVTVTLILTVSIDQIPTVLQEGMIASRDVKSNRNYEIIDEGSTQKFRDEARMEVLPVYDFDVRVVDGIAARVHDAFSAARDRYSDIYAERARGKGRLGRRDPLSKDESAEIKQIFSEKLGITPTPTQWNLLVKERFGRVVQDRLIETLTRAMKRPVVAERAALDAEKERGIVVRRITGQESTEVQPVEEHLADVNLILSTEQLRKKIQDEAISTTGLRAPETAKVIKNIAAQLVEPNCTLNRTEFEKRQEAASSNLKDVIIKIKAGEMIIRDGDRYQPRHIKILSGIRKERRRTSYAVQFSGTFMLVLLVLVVPFYVGERFFHRVRPNRNDHYLMSLVGLALLLIMRLSLILLPGVQEAFMLDMPTSLLAYLLPVAGGTMLLRLFLGAEITLVFAVSISALSGMLVESNVSFVAYALIVNFAAIVSISNADRRTAIIRAGVITGCIAALTVLAVQLFAVATVASDVTVQNTIVAMFCALLAGIGAAIFTMIAAPIVESVSGYTSDIKLLELANLNHPLLRELIVRAPGSYHHSHLVGVLGEAAAESIGANPLLVRVGAYYHDIGKMKKPQYFVENIKGGDNRHERLSAHMSALIIAAHVKDGIEMAQSAGLPKVITDMIPQHHGTRMMKFFYEKAKGNEDPDLQKIDEKEFCYPGPKPQTREAAILMLADTVEASVRALKEKSSTRIQQTVQRGINDIFAESQLDQCDLTLRDLNDIARSFTRILLGIYHQRIEYPKDSEHDKEPEISVIDENSVREDSVDDEPTVKER